MSPAKESSSKRDWTRVRRARIQPPAEVYPVDEWRMVETAFSPEMLAQARGLALVQRLSSVRVVAHHSTLAKSGSKASM